MTAITATYSFTGVGEDFGPRADGIVTLHTTESVATRNTVADARLVAAWQDRSDILGSYNRLICTDGILSTVPDNHASGGMNPSSSGFKPLAWLYDFIDADEIANPNYFSLQLSAVGQKAYFDTNGWPPTIIDGMARSIIDEERRIGRPVVVTNHADFQPPPNRSDAGPICIDLVMKRYAELTAPPEDDVDLSTLTPIVNRKASIASGAAARSKPEFNPKDYDANLISTEPNARSRTAIGWITGTNLTLSDGTVYDPRTRWLMTDSDQHGPIFYHERDVTGFTALETVEVSTGIDPAAYSALQLQGAGLFDEAARFATNAAQILRAKKP